MNLEEKKGLLLKNALDFLNRSNAVEFQSSVGFVFFIQDVDSFASMLLLQIIGAFFSLIFRLDVYQCVLYNPKTLDIVDEVVFKDKKFALVRLASFVVEIDRLKKSNLLAYKEILARIDKIACNEDYFSFLFSGWEGYFSEKVCLHW